MVEFAIICTVLLMLTAGLVDAGRAFYDYNAVAAAARYGARWASVVGGTCDAANNPSRDSSTDTDWCNQEGAQGTTLFWSQSGNKPVWTGTGQTCPSSSTAANSTNSYAASSFAGTGATTIVGAIAQRFDSNSTSTNFVTGNLTPGFNLSQLRVCVQWPDAAMQRSYIAPGDTITVIVYYPFQPVSALITSAQLNLTSDSTYLVQ